MILILRSRHDADMAGLRAQVERLRKERDTALSERNAFKAAAETSATHFVQADAVNEQLVAAERRREAVAVVKGEVLIEGGTNGPTLPSSVAARDRRRAAQLQDRLDLLQAAVLRCTCGGAA